MRGEGLREEAETDRVILEGVSQSRPAWKEPLAKQEAEAAVAGGVLEDVSDDAYLLSSGTNYNGYLRQSGWN